MPGPNTRRRLRIAAKLFGFMAVLVLVAIVAIRWQHHRMWEHQMTLQREAGLPVSREDVEALYPPIPDEENAAPKFLEAGNWALPLNETLRDAILQGTGPQGLNQVTAEQMAAARAHLAENQGALKRAREAAEFPRARYAINFANIFESAPALSQEEKESLGRLNELLCVAISVANRDGDGNDAFENARVGFALARSLESIPCYHTLWVRQYIEGEVAKEVERAVRANNFDDTQLAALDAMLARIPKMRELRPFVEVYLLLYLHTGRRPDFGVNWGAMAWRSLYENVSRAMGRPIGFRPPGALAWVMGLGFTAINGGDGWSAVLTAYNRSLMNAEFGGPTLTPEELGRMKAWAELYNAGMNDPGHLFRPEHYENLNHPLNELRVRIQLERYRLRHGAYPDHLGQLSPEFTNTVPENGYLGAPLLYIGKGASYSLETEGGLHVYSRAIVKSESAGERP